MRYVSRIWNWDWVEPYLPLLEEADMMVRSTNSTSIKDDNQVLPEAPNEQVLSHQQLTSHLTESAKSREEREMKIQLARERAMKRRKLK
jgi:ATP-dependent RNA helicase DHX8/PRP22